VSEPEPVAVDLAESAVPDAAAPERQRDPDAHDPDHHAATAPRLSHAHADTAAPAVVSIAAIALIRDERGRVLLVKQRGGPFAGSWLLPGGRAAEDESAVHALVREVREETGLTLTDAIYIAGYRTSGDDYDINVLMYRGPAEGMVSPEAGSDARWIDADAIPDPHPALRRQLFDAGVGTDDAAAIQAALEDAGISMERLA
jgi:8-oxo-dGTP diphosphatase